MKNQPGGIATALLSLACLVQGAQAQTPPPGRLLASNCFQCHGTNGQGPGFDRLTGKSTQEIYKELVEFRSGKEGKGIMARHTMGFTDTQLRDLSAWLATQR